MNLIKLTKQEQAVAIGTFISMLGQDLVNKRIDKEKLERVLPIFNEMQDNTTPKQKREAMISLLGKAVDEFLEK
ncbi:phage protein [Bacillus cereus BAG1X2-3]|nr:phage protein [Bacillus cereus BAG1X1-1]EOO48838.1 phage protein [Bacillus cereus BAG1X2-1]EOO52540.1 phage protein [Bacillus cereus BAG1X2-2]EOO59534.1 phage protein [Bacillus cereus BAG1X2-3]EOP05814.1 phage protein [Bacillus cereus BAG2O-1]